MSRTYRKDEGVKFQEGNPKRLSINHYCRCEHCTTRRNERKERIADKEMKRQLDDALEWNHTENELLDEYWYNKYYRNIA